MAMLIDESYILITFLCCVIGLVIIDVILAFAGETDGVQLPAQWVIAYEIVIPNSWRCGVLKQGNDGKYYFDYERTLKRNDMERWLDGHVQ